jgi:phosphoribosylaminoimidazole carboxylase (NCAIR synthetase)
MMQEMAQETRELTMMLLRCLVATGVVRVECITMNSGELLREEMAKFL